jgi:DNA-binding MarR family transcriptional regulator
MEASAMPEREHLATLLRAPYRELVRVLYQRLAEQGFDDLQPAHSQVFPYLREGPSQSSLLAERAQITKQSMGALLTSLEERGYVSRRRSPLDRRAKIVELTSRGHAAERAATAIIDAIEAEWTGLLGADDAAELRRLLERLLAGLRAEPPPEG